MAKAGKRKRPTKGAKATKPKKRAPEKRKKSRGGSESRSQRGSVPVRRGTKPSTDRRARSSAKPLTPAQKAAATRKANAAKKEAARQRKSERQRQRRREQREAEKIAIESSGGYRDERDELIEIMESMTPEGFALTITEPEVAADTLRSPWTVVGKFDPLGNIGYAELHSVFLAWRDNLLLEGRIHPQRVSQIRISYRGEDGSGDSAVSHVGPWELTVSEMAGELNPRNPESLSARYKNTVVLWFYVYFSADIIRTSHWFPHYQRDASDE